MAPFIRAIHSRGRPSRRAGSRAGPPVSQHRSSDSASARPARPSTNGTRPCRWRSRSPVVGLGPPAVEDRAVQPAIQHHLLPAGAARLHRTARHVQPDVDALDEVTAHVDVVVLDEEDFRQGARPASGARYPAARPCPAGRADAGCQRTRTARACAGFRSRGESLHVLDEQVAALVRGKAAGEPDRQRIETQRPAQCAPTSPAPLRCDSAWCAARRRAISMSWVLSVWCVSQSSPSSIASTRSQKPGSPTW